MVPGAWGLCDVARVHVCAFGVYEGIGMHAEPMGGETGELWETRWERMLTIEATADDVQIRRWFKSNHVTQTPGPFRASMCAPDFQGPSPSVKDSTTTPFYAAS